MDRAEFLKGAACSLALLSVDGCFTPKLYESHDTKYEETALSYLVTEDGSRLVVLGKRYHYIFNDITPSLRHILGSPLRKAVAADLTNFYVKRDNGVTGNYLISLTPQASEEEKQEAIAAGFATPDLNLSGHLEGMRYSAEGFPPIPPTLEFTRPYVVEIREQESGAWVAGKILLTPIALAADGALILGALLLIGLAYGR